MFSSLKKYESRGAKQQVRSLLSRLEIIGPEKARI